MIRPGDLAPARPARPARRAEFAKLAAFLRRDAIIAWSYRFDFFSELLGLFVQGMLFYFVGLMVDPTNLPRYGGTQATYLEYVAIGLCLGLFVQVALGTVARVIREEQLMGTIESLMLTPTRPWTIQVGSVAYDMMYVPIRAALFLVIVAVAFGLDINLSGLLPAFAILAVFIPFVWGLGLMGGAMILAFRRGAGFTAYAATLLTISAGAYFPLGLLPGWLERLAQINPLAIALDGMRQVLLGDAGWSDSLHVMLVVAPMSAASIAVAAYVFRRVLARELRRGTLGEY